MYSTRHNDIIEVLKKSGSISVSALAQKLYVSTSTIRRDLKTLEKQGMVLLNYGMVSFRMYDNMTLGITTRNQINIAEKQIIGKKAAKLIKNGDVLLLDTSTTVQSILPFIMDKNDLTVITNSARICSILVNSTIKVFSTGGLLYKHCEGFCGGFAQEALRNFQADWLFFSSKGISEDGIISDDSEMETYIRRIMLQVAKKKVYLYDHSKFGKKYIYQLCQKEDVDMIISNTELPVGFERPKTTLLPD